MTLQQERIKTRIIFDEEIQLEMKNVLIPKHHDVGMILNGIRKRWLKNLHSQKGIYLFFSRYENMQEGLIEPVTKTLNTINMELDNPDLIFIHVKIENTFG